MKELPQPNAIWLKVNRQVLHWTRSLLLAAMLSGSCYHSYAQSAPETPATVVIDPATGLTDKSFLFDKNFYVAMKVPKDDRVYGVGIMKVSNTRDRDFADPGELSPVDTFFFENIKDEPDKKLLRILMPPLSPNRLYDIVLTKAVAGQPLLTLLEVNELLFANSYGPELIDLVPGVLSGFGVVPTSCDLVRHLPPPGPVRAQIIATFDSLILSNDGSCGGNQFNLYQAIADGNATSSLPLTGNESTYLATVVTTDPATQAVYAKYNELAPFFWRQPLLSNPTYHLWYYRQIFQGSLLAHYTALTTTDAFAAGDIAVITANLGSLQAAYAPIAAKGNKDVLKVLANLYHSTTRALIPSRLNGDTTLNAAYSAGTVDSHDLPKRIRICDKNIALLKSVSEEIKDLMITAPPVNANLIIAEIDALITKLGARKERMLTIINTMRRQDNLKLKILISANTHFVTISDEANKFILPDFGLLFVPNSTKNILRPFLGVNINFGPVDKDVKTRFLSRDVVRGDSRALRFIRNRFSLTAGVAFGTIKIENERDDLFASANIFTGVALKINRAIRLSGGLFWYDNENDNPAISSKKISVYPYMAVSFDISFRNATQGTFSKIIP